MSYIPEPITRIDKYLAHIAGNMDVALPDYPITRKEHYLAAWAEKSGFEDVEITGEPPLTLENAIGKPLKGLKVYGRSKQVTTTGAQLLDLDAIGLKTGGGATIRRLDDGGFLVDGTPGQAYEQYITRVVINFSQGTYFISGGRYADGCAVVQINILNADGTRTYKNNASFDVLGTEQEIVLIIQSVSEEPINNYKIYPMINAGSVALPFEPYTGGKPSPSPDYSQEIESVGQDGKIGVEVRGENPNSAYEPQSMDIATPNGLPGIPVSSGGNYTDVDGQQWVCDEVDFGRGVYVQRVSYTVVDGDKTKFNHTSSNYWNLPWHSSPGCTNTNKHINNFFSDNTFGSNDNYSFLFTTANWMKKYFDTVDKLNEFCKSKYDAGTPLTLYYTLTAPIETPLTSDQLAAYKSLHTYKGTTIIDNDAGAYMSVRYEKMK